MVRSGLRLLIERHPEFEVAGEAIDGREAVERLDYLRNGAAGVDVAVIDVAMPGLNGIEAAGQITRKWPDIGIVMLSMHADETYILRCLRAGARGYVLKESAEGELIAAIRAVFGGRSFFSPKVRQVLEKEHVDRLRRQGVADSYDLLTEREREVLQLIAEGHSNKEMAGRLCLSVYTVETHRKRIVEKLGLHGTADLILYAVRKGLAR